MAKAAATKKVVRKRRERKNVEKGAAHIRATYNNTIVTITDVNGNTVSWGVRRRARLQGVQKIYCICRADGGGKCGENCRRQRYEER